MVASSFTQLAHHVARDISLDDIPGVVRAAAIYGANASGKSKFIDALATLRRLVTKSRGPRQPLGVEAFRLDKKSVSEPTRFEIIFSNRERFFQYGVVADNQAIHEEWLFQLKGKRETKCFERFNRDGKSIVSIGPGFARKGSAEYKKLELIAGATGNNQTFINKAWENQSSRADDVVHWFEEVLAIIGADSEFQALETAFEQDEQFSEFIANYLKSAGTGIDEIRTEQREIDLQVRLSGIDEERRQKLLADLDSGLMAVIMTEAGNLSTIAKGNDGKIVEYVLRAVHATADGDSVAFDFRSESHGTQRLVHLLPAVYQGRLSNKVFVVDELDRKLHTLLTRQFLETFLSATQKTNSQIIFTTHDTNLLDQEVLRRDEVWFVEKCQKLGCSVIYPLTDFDPRHDLKIDKGYLLGRFGAIPFFGDFSRTIESKNNEQAGRERNDKIGVRVAKTPRTV